MKERSLLTLAYGFVLGAAYTSMYQLMPDAPDQAFALVVTAAVLATCGVIVVRVLRGPTA